MFNALFRILSFSRRQMPLLAIDMSPIAVKVLELTKEGSRFFVKHYAVVPFPPEAIVEHEIKDIQQVSTALSTAILQSGTKLTNAITFIPSSLVITKTITVDAHLTGLALQSQVEIEATRFVPYPLDEVALDFEVKGIVPGNAEKMEIFVVAAREEYVQAMEDVLLAAGITPKIVEVEAFAIERAFPLLLNQLADYQENKTVAVVDIGAATTSITIVKNQKTVYTREEVFGGKQLTEAIQKRYGMNYQEAGLAKKQNTLADDYQESLLSPFKFMLIPLMQRTLQFFFSANITNSVDYIILGGGGACLPDLPDLLEKELGIPCILANPFYDMGVAKNVDLMHLTNDAPALMLAVGLALRNFE